MEFSLQCPIRNTDNGVKHYHWSAFDQGILSLVLRVKCTERETIEIQTTYKVRSIFIQHNTYVHLHTCTHTYVYTRMHARTHARTHTHTHTHTHARTHTAPFNVPAVYNYWILAGPLLLDPIQQVYQRCWVGWYSFVRPSSEQVVSDVEDLL